MIFLVAITLILSFSTAFAADDDLSENLEIESTDDVELEDEVLTSDETDVELSNSNDEVLEAETGSGAIQTIEMGKVTKRYNGAIQYKATFHTIDGKPLANQLVYFEVDDSKDYEATTDSNGVALLNIFIANGNHKIAALSTDPLSVNYDNIKVFNVLTGGKNIKMYYDDGNVYKVRVFDDNGNPVKSGQKVTFKLNGKKYVKKTDKKGYAKLKITLKPGLYEISAKYKDFQISNTVKVKEVLKAKTGAVKSKSSRIKFVVKYLGKNKKNKKISVKFNKKTYKAKTNKKGVAIFKLKTPKKLGTYKVVVSYKKLKEYYQYSQYRV